MTLTLRQVLEHASVLPAEPLVLTGGDNLHRLIRWIHSSEVLDIANLLRGGELLLTGGTVLASSTPAEQRRYVRTLAGRGVAAVGIETADTMPGVPADVVAEARSLDFPVIELRKVVPFVEVAEAINGELVNESVTNLRYTSELSHTLTGMVADGAGVQELLDVIVDRTGLTAALYDVTGGLMAAATAEAGVGRPSAPSATGPQPSEFEEESVGSSLSWRVSIRGLHAATLVLRPEGPADGTRLDPALLDLVADAATEALSFSLMRTNPPSARDFAATELVRLCSLADPPRRQVESLGRIVGLPAADPVIGIVAHSESKGSGLARLDSVLRRFGRSAVDNPTGSQLQALVSLPGRARAAVVRAELVQELEEWIRGREALLIFVGPMVASLDAAPLSLGAALETFRLVAPGRGVHAPAVVDAHAELVRRFAAEAPAGALTKLWAEELGMLDPLPERTRATLLETLECYFDTGCSKSETAARLHVTRQSVYGRLERAFGLLGGDPTGTPRALGLHLALRTRNLA